MKLAVLSKLLFLLLLTTLFVTTSKSAPAYDMACCEDLNCEGNYADCIDSCAYYFPGSQECMDNCFTSAVACARTLCDPDCGNGPPCWFDEGPGCRTPWSDPYSCSGSSDCSFPFVCMGGICMEGGCISDWFCITGGAYFHCEEGWCQPN